jgi:tetratricopeptide (TPR) repeat protein
VRFAAAFPFVALALTANVLFAIGTVKAERLLYLPSVGWVLLAAYGINQLLLVPRYRTATAAVVCAVLTLFSARTWVRNWDWGDTMSLYRSMVRGAPYSEKARSNYGIVLQEVDGDPDAAMREYRRALAIYPVPETAMALGILEEHREHLAEAQEWYEKALQLQPAFREAHVHLCDLLLNDERFAAAVRACRRGLRYDPTDPDLLKRLGAGLVALGAAPKGLELMRHSLVTDGGGDALRTYLARETGASPGRRVEATRQ